VQDVTCELPVPPNFAGLLCSRNLGTQVTLLLQTDHARPTGQEVATDGALGAVSHTRQVIDVHDTCQEEVGRRRWWLLHSEK
jgi:hypothetical protein